MHAREVLCERGSLVGWRVILLLLMMMGLLLRMPVYIVMI